MRTFIYHLKSSHHIDHHLSHCAPGDSEEIISKSQSLRSKRAQITFKIVILWNKWMLKNEWGVEPFSITWKKMHVFLRLYSMHEIKQSFIIYRFFCRIACSIEEMHNSTKFKIIWIRSMFKLEIPNSLSALFNVILMGVKIVKWHHMKSLDKGWETLVLG